ncbi:MAG: PCRF domain-containing protein, partial [Elusimicrobiota bacterium]|nr:PCRF domain-containing protein [Elusimicrobiota bacterium]
MDKEQGKIKSENFADKSAIAALINSQKEKLEFLKKKLNIAAKLQRAEKLEKESLETSFWNNAGKAKTTMMELDSLKNECAAYFSFEKNLSESSELFDFLSQSNDDSLYNELFEKLLSLDGQLKEIEIKTALGDPCDKNNAIMSIHSGAGGTESCDWTAMLSRMYARWAEKRSFEVETVYSADGDETGLKNITMLIKGKNKNAFSYAYGLLTAEIGVHRLIRISPFDSNKRRHTTFAAVDVIPEANDEIEIKIEDKDIRIDTYRSSGAGGQHVNTTDS